ncbi:MAG: hypothetical protein H8E55_62010 [Pelagibacterales bacterium]|nr:hypothetical protein [Pelagibacterales bacterium]
MKKLYKINLFTSPGKVLRKSVLHKLSFYLSTGFFNDVDGFYWCEEIK